MLTIKVYNEAGQEIGSEQIDEKLLGGEVNAKLLKQAAVMYEANLRQGTVQQKTRGQVEGSTKKIYKQKGTGRARMGPVRQPVRRGGGRAFPRTPRDFGKDMPKKMRRLARNNAVLARIQGNDAVIVDGLNFGEPKTKRFAAMLKAVKADAGCVFATRGLNENLYRSGRNIAKTRVLDVAELNAREILLKKRLIFTRDAFSAFREMAGKAGA